MRTFTWCQVTILCRHYLLLYLTCTFTAPTVVAPCDDNKAVTDLAIDHPLGNDLATITARTGHTGIIANCSEDHCRHQDAHQRVQAENADDYDKQRVQRRSQACRTIVSNWASRSGCEPVRGSRRALSSMTTNCVSSCGMLTTS